MGLDCFVSRSGYTGEDGFEISVPAADAESSRPRCSMMPTCCRSALAPATACGSRPGSASTATTSTTTTTPVEAALEWSLQKSRRAGGARAGGYPGADVIARQLADGAPRRRVGLRTEGRAPVRGGAALFASENSGRADRHGDVGRLWPERQRAGRDGLPADRSSPRSGTLVFAEVRGQKLPMRVAAMPFTPHSYKR